MITCPVCWRTSYHPQDAEHGWCANCCFWTSVPDLLATRPDLQAQARLMADCLFCGEPITDGEKWKPVATVDAGGWPARRRGHPECEALGIVGHVWGVCGCHGFDHSRAAALELGRRITAGQARFEDGS